MTTDATLIRAGYVLTAANPPVIADGAVVVRGDRIEAVGRYADLAPRWSGAVTVEDPNGMLVPGFVNTHGHFSEALTTGLGDRLSLWEWIAAVVRPVGPHLTREMARVGTILRGAEMMLSGITTVNDMFVCMPGGGEVSTGVVEGLEALGLRGNVSFGAQDLFGDWDDRAVLAEHRGLAEAAQDSPLVQFRVGVTSIVALSDRLIDSSAELGAELGKPLHAHFHEVREEVTEARLRFGSSALEVAADRGLLDEGAVAAHCVWLSEVDIEVLVDRRVGVAHNPVANMILGSGVCPLGRLSRAGIAVGLGVDGPASNDGQNMIETLKTAALLQKVHHLDPRVIDAPTALGLATIGGARALGMADAIGSIEAGKQADLVLLSGEAISTTAIHDPLQTLVYCLSGEEVRDVWIAGRRVVQSRTIPGIDLASVRSRARRLAGELAAKSGLPSRLAGSR
mgnify:CR=1 FL=1